MLERELYWYLIRSTFKTMAYQVLEPLPEYNWQIISCRAIGL